MSTFSIRGTSGLAQVGVVASGSGIILSRFQSNALSVYCSQRGKLIYGGLFMFDSQLGKLLFIN